MADALPAPARPALHRALAERLEGEGADADTLARHYHGAGEAAVAGRWARRAAEASLAALSFDHAAGRFADALAWLAPTDAATRVALLRGRAEALARASRSREAAVAWQAVEAEAEPAEARAAMRRAVEHLFYSGQPAAALAAAAPHLRALRVRVPRTAAGALLGTLGQLAVLARRGLHLRERPRSPEAGDRMDLRYVVGRGLSLGENMATASVFLRCLREALRLGDGPRAARALCHYGFMLAFGRGARARARSAAALARADALAVAHGRPDLRAQRAVFEGLTALVQGRYAEGDAQVTAGLETFARAGWDATYVRTVGWMLQVSSAVVLGDLRGVLERSRRWVVEQRARGNAYGVAFGQVFEAVGLLALEGRDPVPLCADSVGRLDPRLPHDVVRSMALVVRLMGHLYAGRPDAAHAEARAAWGRLRRAGIFMMPVARIVLSGLRGRAAAAAGDRRDALRCARALEREDAPHAVGDAAVLRALLARRPEVRDAALARAEDAYQAGAMVVHAAAVARVRGAARADAQGAAAVAAADAVLSGQGLCDPIAWVRTVVPDCPAPGAAAQRR